MHKAPVTHSTVLTVQLLPAIEHLLSDRTIALQVGFVFISQVGKHDDKVLSKVQLGNESVSQTIQNHSGLKQAFILSLMTLSYLDGSYLA